MNQGVVLFHTTTSALRAEKTAQKAGLKVKLVPTPRELSSDCGIALRFNLADRQPLEQALSAARLECEFNELQGD